MFRKPRRSRIQQGFSVPRVNVIESDEGFSIEVIPAGFPGYQIRYTQGNKTLLVDAEAAGKDYWFIIFPDSIQSWDPPYDKEQIDKATKKMIIDNICRAFASKGQKIDVSEK